MKIKNPNNRKSTICGCSCKEKKITKSITEAYPEKTAELNTYLEQLPLTSNIIKNQGFLISCLHKAQSIFGYLPEAIQILIAEKLRLNLSDVYGVISFYSFFTTKPKGKYKIDICLGTACYVKGADKVLEEFERLLNIKDGETSKDMKFSLSGLRCVGACSLAPVVLINNKVYSEVTADKVEKILKDLA